MATVPDSNATLPILWYINKWLILWNGYCTTFRRCSEEINIEESLIAQQQTLLWNEDKYLRIAPGEHNVPTSILFDEHCEELSFPSIYFGQIRKFKEGIIVTPYMIATSELRRSDRRGVTPQHLLYVAMKILRLRTRDSLTVAFKFVGKFNNTLTKAQVESTNFINDCLETNLAFIRSIPNSTYYWSQPGPVQPKVRRSSRSLFFRAQKWIIEFYAFRSSI